MFNTFGTPMGGTNWGQLMAMGNPGLAQNQAYGTGRFTGTAPMGFGAAYPGVQRNFTPSIGLTKAEAAPVGTPDAYGPGTGTPALGAWSRSPVAAATPLAYGARNNAPPLGR